MRIMQFAEYQQCLTEISYGKRLPSAVYLYRDPAARFGELLDALLAALVRQYEISDDFNILKLRTDELKISFLSYPDFPTLAHPALRQALTIDLVTGKARRSDYTTNPNPPILHRKESFLPPDHPRRAEFEALTRAEEAAGLYADTTTIGFKLNWERLLTAKGLTIQGHTLQGHPPDPAIPDPRPAPPEIQPSTDPFIPQPPPRPATPVTRHPDSPSIPKVERHKTALTRYDLSKPVKSLLEHGLLRPGLSFFDYGCGQGSDLRGLQSLGYSAEGWDPVFRPEIARREADVVNLGYVINVIEDPAERLEALVDAYRHTKRVLTVSALITETVETGHCPQYGDGILTRRNTFQKYFDQQELQQYIEDALETTAVPVALGVFYVFRDPVDQQDFLSARSRRVIDWTQISARLGLGGPPEDRWEALYREHRDLLDEFGQLALQQGRIPDQANFSKLDDLCAKLGSAKRALRAFVQGGGAPGLAWAEVSQRFGIGLPPRPQWQLLYQQHQELLDAFWQLALQLGRAPAPQEFPQFPKLCAAVGSPKRALNIFVRQGGAEPLQHAADNRRNDLLVYLAMSNLRRKVPFGHLSPSLRLDVREFFGNYQRALAKGLELLYAAGDPGEIELACEDLKLGWQDEQALYIHRSLLDQLPGVLRAYVGCATTLFGDVTQADVIKIHKHSGKVTFLIYDDFDNQPLPALQHRIKVNLRTRWVQAYNHTAEGQLLYFKERFLPPDHPRFREMAAFSAKLRKLGVSEQVGFGPKKSEYEALLVQHGFNENLNKPQRTRRMLSRKEL